MSGSDQKCRTATHPGNNLKQPSNDRTRTHIKGKVLDFINIAGPSDTAFVARKCTCGSDNLHQALLKTAIQMLSGPI